MLVAAATFSLWVLLVLLIVLGSSVTMFLLLTRRWTLHRLRASLQQWSDEFGYTLKANCVTPPPLQNFAQVAAYCISNMDTSIVRFRTGTTPASKTPQQGSAWHVLVRKIPTAWPDTALRPAANHTSLVDLFSLSSYPSLLSPERFVLFGTETNAATAIAHSHLPALIPQDVGIILTGQYLLLDFSARVFDELELDRIVALADQVYANLPIEDVVSARNA